jgi:exopolyphosphatase/pppGpp-phosphohydrolase
MRLGVLDIGSNTGHLLVVDAHGGAAPLPAYSFKQPLRLAEHLDEAGDVTEAGIEALTAFTRESVAVGEEKGVSEMLAFATSAVRDAGNSQQVLDRVHAETGVEIEVLPGDDEARLTFLAVRRWFGWSAGRLAVFDIGGGSLEIAAGTERQRPGDVRLLVQAGSLAGDRGRPGRAAVRRLVAAARCRPARAQLLRRPADGGGAAGAAPDDPRLDRRGRGQDTARRPAGHGGGDLEDVPLPGTHLRCRPER